MRNSSSNPIPWRTVALAVIAVFTCSTAVAQWQWIDSSGAKVFSDTAPPPSVPDKDILKRPRARAEAKTPVAAEVNAPAPKVTGKDEQLEAKKRQQEKQAEDAAQAKKKSEAEAFAKARADNCERAKRAKSTLDSGVRMSTTNAQGEREIMDSKARAAESKRIEDIIQADCSPLPVAPKEGAPAN